MRIVIQEDLDRPAKHGKITYNADVMKEAIMKFKDRDLYGCVGKPILAQDGVIADIKIEDISHSFTSLKVENGNLVGELTILGTPKGKVLEDIKDCVEYGIAGYILKDSDGKITHLTIHSINAIHNPMLVKETSKEKK